eukprot:scaffold5079_cov169-Amphora_coffeaeformis.AAC.7
MDQRKTAFRTPTFKLPVLVATILYTAFAHVDHWPVPLVEAYAADCFGSRAWVDDADCELLVKNLALVHTNNAMEDSTDPEQENEAARVYDAYKDFSMDEESQPAPTIDASNVAQRRPSMSSVASNSSAGHRHSPKPETGTTEQTDKTIPSDKLESKTKQRTKKKSSSKAKEDGNSSSSGEEEEEDTDVVMSESNDDESKQGTGPKDTLHPSSLNGSTGDIAKSSKKLHPIVQRHLRLERVRARYFGVNRDAAHDAVSSALLDRVEQKSKQNSGLLQTLPSFAPIPRVRALVTENLGKWLQSPALAGLSRTLFSAAVENMKNVDPPLPEDLAAIDSILAMKLKANQFSAHVENVTAIASRIPTATVANHMYSQLLKNALVDANQGASDDSLSMVAAIHKILPIEISYEAMAASLLMILAEGDGTQHVEENKRKEQLRLIRRLRRLIRSLASKLGQSFDGFQLLANFLEFDVSEDKWSVEDEEDKARLMFQCVTLHVAAVAGIKDPSKTSNWKALVKSPEVEEKVRQALRKSRRMLLHWCCNDYGPSYSRRRKKKQDSDILEGAASPDFVSAIGPDSQEESIPPWLNTMRCLLMIEEVDSELMNHFLVPADASGQLEDGWNDEKERIALCANFGADVDDVMIAEVLKSCNAEAGGLLPDMSIKLIEHLFESCGRREGAALRVSDPDLVWEMYKLAHYTPSKELISVRIAADEEENGHSADFSSLPRLAYTGLWWRVTILGLVMCGSNPEKIGSVVWKDHPTLSGLIKMVTSTKYRFPTVDCDEVSRERMKQEEQAARDEETKIAELLFLPPKKKTNGADSKRTGSRVSRRLLKQQQEKEAAAELAENNRRKKLLRSAQKSIMLWDPDGPARKPPRESAELLVSADAMFGLSDSFQRCTSPDFLLHTIGGTTRGAIERAYDWLIPIISRLPDTISRLPPSTSCFLLLRAYGADGERRAQLKELSTPLLHHVQDSLRGTLGEAESTEAFDILLSDVASHISERRKSSRRVLQDALGKNKAGSLKKPSVSAWMLNIIEVKHAHAVVPIAMSRLATAAKYERGRVLKSIVVALQAYTTFLEGNEIPVAQRFPLLLSFLVSQRPNVYAEAIDAFPDFRSLVIQVINDEIFCGEGKSKISDHERFNYVSIHLRTETDKVKEKLLPGSLLHTTCILLSVWSGGEKAKKEDKSRIDSLVDALMLPSDDVESVNRESNDTVGLSSAINAETKYMAMTVDSWIMLCKARSDAIGKRAALSAPEGFLGRLLLSSGLPKMSLHAMVDRISKLGSASADVDSAYRNLLVPSASSEWDIGRVGNSEDIARRLLGRLSAYLRAGILDEKSSSSFVHWLQIECRGASSPKPRLAKKARKSKSAVTIPDLSSISALLNGPSFLKRDGSIGPNVDVSDLDDLISIAEAAGKSTDDTNILDAIKESFSMESPRAFHEALENYIGADDSKKCPPPNQVAVHLSKQIEELGSKPQWAVTALLRWLPSLSREADTPELWKVIFAKQDDLLSLFLDELILLCIQCWSESHIQSCNKWISSVNLDELKALSARRLADFLVKTSKLAPPEMELLADTPFLDANPDWGTSETHAASIANVCIQASIESTNRDPNFVYRNSLPPWVVLLQLLGSRGKKQLVYLTETILRFQKENPDCEGIALLDGAILRLYLLQPLWMNVGSSPVRMSLLRASEAHATVWGNWKSSVDDLLEEAINNLAAGEARAARVLNDHARKHPLLILRKTNRFVSILEEDATVKDGAPDIRGVVHGKSLSGPAEARFLGKPVLVHVKHWGFSFTEALWNIVLDIFTGIPKEVIFQSGLSIGFVDILNTYLRLLSIQLHLLSADATSKLKAKFADVLKMFGETNAEGCHAWWATVVDGSEVRNILVSCDLLSPQHAIESIRSAK